MTYAFVSTRYWAEFTKAIAELAEQGYRIISASMNSNSFYAIMGKEA